jgi:Rad3-related DNA helicase
MEFDLQRREVTLSVGEFANFSTIPSPGGDGSGGGVWRAQLGSHWHRQLREHDAADPAVQFEVGVAGSWLCRGWKMHLAGRIDQVRESPGAFLVREIKTVMQPLPVEEAKLRVEYPEYFKQLAGYVFLKGIADSSSEGGARCPQTAESYLGPAEAGRSTLEPNPTSASPRRVTGELVFVEAGTGFIQTVALGNDAASAFEQQADRIVDFLENRRAARERRLALEVAPAFASLRPGQEGVQTALRESLGLDGAAGAQSLLFEAPTGFGKTGCLLEFALRGFKDGIYDRVVYLTGKSTGQIQVTKQLETMIVRPGTAGRVPVWQVRSKAEHCVNHEFHCIPQSCAYLDGLTERWPAAGLSRHYLIEGEPRDLDSLRASGRDARICPYEITRAALAYCDVWIGDYNYVFSPSTRGVFYGTPGFDPARTLLVVDEAHNLPARAADAWSRTSTAHEAQRILAELDHLRAPPALGRAWEQWWSLLAHLKPADSLDPQLEEELWAALRRLSEHTAAAPLDLAALGPELATSLWKPLDLLTLAEHEKLPSLAWVPEAGVLQLTCLDASAETGPILKSFRNAVLTSATLTPADAVAKACGLDAPAAGSGATRLLRAPTPWRDGAYRVAVDARVDTRYRERRRHFDTTARTVDRLHNAAAERGHPAAIVFFPSYAYANEILDRCVNGLGMRVALQPRGVALAEQSAFIEEAIQFNDAVFLVLGTGFAEGIDHLGGRITHAMVVGPALPEVNPVQAAKMNAGTDSRAAAFRRVYQIPGMQKVNQAIGRLVRAPGQSATVLLHCSRFAGPDFDSLLDPAYRQDTALTTDDELKAWLGTE